MSREEIIKRVERMIWHHEHSGGSRMGLAERIVKYVLEGVDRPLPEDVEDGR